MTIIILQGGKKILKVIELFAGIGAPSMALTNCNIPHEIIGISEIEKQSVKAYELFHGPVENFGDISQIKELPPCDFIHASSPCQSFSPAGKREGLRGESGLLLDFYRLMNNYYERGCLPTFVSYENVPEMKLLFPEVFDEFCKKFDEWGYNLYWDILECYKFGNPTLRKRLFAIAILKEKDNGLFKMPKESKISESMEEFLWPTEKVDASFYCKPDIIFHPAKKEKVNRGQYIGYLELGVNVRNQSNRVYDRDDLCPTITAAGSNFWIKEPNGYRKVMPVELWCMSGFSLDQFKIMQDNFAKTRIIKMLGNSIPLGPLEAIYSELKKCFSFVREVKI